MNLRDFIDRVRTNHPGTTLREAGGDVLEVGVTSAAGVVTFRFEAASTPDVQSSIMDELNKAWAHREASKPSSTGGAASWAGSGFGSIEEDTVVGEAMYLEPEEGDDE